jgi:hypothetical protein
VREIGKKRDFFAVIRLLPQQIIIKNEHKFFSKKNRFDGAVCN